MSRLTVYILKEILKICSLIFLISCIIFLVYSSVHFLEDAVRGGLPVSNLFALIILKVIIACEILLPLSLFVSGVLILANMQDSKEVIALQSSGIAHARLNIPLIIIACVLGLTTAFLSFIVRPWAYDVRGALEVNFENQHRLQGLKQEKFYQLNQGGLVLFLGQKSGNNEGMKVFVQKKSDDSRQIIFARDIQAVESGNNFLLSRGSIYTFQGHYTHKINIKFAKGVFELSGLSKKKDAKFKTRSSPIDKLLKSDSRRDIAEAQWRFLNPASAVLLTMSCLPLSIMLPWKRNMKITIAMLLFGTYYILQTITENFVEKGIIASYPGSLYAGMFLLSIYIFMCCKQYRRSLYHNLKM